MKKQRNKLARSKRTYRRIYLFLLVIVIAAVTSSAILWNTPISEIQVSGAAQYTEEEVKNLIFSGSSSPMFLPVWLKETFSKHKNFLRITSYELEFESIHKLNIYVDENTMVGCVSYGGSFLYFDKDGMVVESRTSRFEGIPIVEGLNYEEIIVGQKMKSDAEEVFQNALRLTQLLQNRGIAADSIYCSYNNEFQFVVGDITVELGMALKLEEKVTEYYAMQEVLEGREGTLYLDNYDSKGPNQGYVFKEKNIS